MDESDEIKASLMLTVKCDRLGHTEEFPEIEVRSEYNRYWYKKPFRIKQKSSNVKSSVVM